MNVMAWMAWMNDWINEWMNDLFSFIFFSINFVGVIVITLVLIIANTTVSNKSKWWQLKTSFKFLFWNF